MARRESESVSRFPRERSDMPEDWDDDYENFALYGDVPAPRYAGEGLAGDLLDEVIPGGIDWRRLVTDHPLPVLLVAAAGGYLLGRHRGKAVIGAVTALAANRVARSFGESLAERADDLADDLED